MAKNDNPHALRLYESIKKYSDKVAADKIIEGISLSKSANAEKKFIWAENICTRLDEVFDTEIVQNIRMDCACGPAIGKMEKLKVLYKDSKDLTDFADKMNKLDQGFTLEYEDNSLYLVYPRCYCSCVKSIDKNLSKTWCYCTLGYTKRMFQFVMDKEIDVELIESVKTGSDKCIIRIV